MLAHTIGVGTGAGRGPGSHDPLTFRSKIFLNYLLSFLKTIFCTTNDSPGRGGHKSTQKCFLEGFVFAQDEMEVY